MNAIQYYRAVAIETIPPVSTDFIMTFTLTANDSITLPLVSTGTYNFSVNWGDGTSDVITTWNQAERVHSYAGQPAGDYVVTIAGTCTAFNFGSVTTSRLKLKAVNQWGDTGLDNLSFVGSSNFIQVAPGLRFYGTSLVDAFRSTKLAELPVGFIAHAPNFTNAGNFIVLTSSLTTIHGDLFANCPGITSLFAAFQGTGLTSIPAGLLDPLQFLGNATNLFLNCTSLVGAIPVDFFRFNTTITAVNGAFSNTRINSIPVDLFRNNTSITNFSSCFNNNPNLTTIPVDLFRYNTNASTFNATFSSTAITSLPVDLFRYNPSVTDFSFTFLNCSALTSLPVDLLRYNTNATIFNQTFRGTSITSLPVDLFRYNTSANNFLATFFGCTGLTSLPSNLFAFCPNVTTFNQCFRACTGLTSIPSSLFSANTNVTDFTQCFLGCTNITAIPAGFLDANTNAQNLTSMFGSCFNITAIPAGLLNNNTALTNISGLFSFTGVTAIPSNLFANNASITNASAVFQSTAITSVPAGLLDPLINVTLFNDIFRQCNNLTTVPTNLFNLNTKVTNYATAFFNSGNLNVNVSSLVSGMDFTKCTTTNQMFSGCTSLTGNGQDLINKSKAPGYTVGTASNTGSYRTFFGCTSLNDFATISANYK